jgi:drug/metabolite transporter (DMT)-like permease
MAIIFGLSLAAGQMLFKLTSLQTDVDGKPLPLFQLLFTAPMIAAVALYALTTLLYVYLLQQVPLSRAYMFSLAASALVPIGAIILFNEALNVRYVIGAAFVFLGVAITASS